MSAKAGVPETLKNLFFMLYFPILTAERVISLVSFFSGEKTGYSWLDWYMAVLTIAAIAGAYAYPAIKCPGAVNPAAPKSDKEYSDMCVAAGILLLGGMVHTVGTIPPIQFASYGMLLVSMAIQTAQSVKSDGKPLFRWLSFGYILTFSMAIPVVYTMESALSAVFYPVEMTASAGMVALFTIMLRRFYTEKGVCSFAVCPIVFAVVMDAAVLALRWAEEINFFVLIFICVTVLLWIAGRVVRDK